MKVERSRGHAELAPWRVAILERLAPVSAICAIAAMALLGPDFYRRNDVTSLGLIVGLAAAWSAAALIRVHYVLRVRLLLWVAAVFVVIGIRDVGITGGLGALILAIAILSAVLIDWHEAVLVTVLVFAGVIAWIAAVVAGWIDRPPLDDSDVGAIPLASRTLFSIGAVTVLTVTATASLIRHLSSALSRSERLVGELRQQVEAREEEARRRGEAERALWRAQKNEILGRLAGGVAHDVNNSLTVIGTLAEVTVRNTALPGDVREDMSAILEACAHGAALNRQLLAVGRRDIAQPRRIGLGDAIDKAVAMARPMLGKSIELHVDRADDVPAVCVDPAQLQQALLNLMINARDAMPEGGALRVSIEARGEAPTYALTSPGPTGAVRVHVRDTGSGIAPDVLPKIFEPFFTTKEVGRGTGLGLAMVCAFAEASGGRVGAVSELGAGSTFTLELPAAPARDQ